jgi:ADP-ribosylglycohydrolase
MALAIVDVLADHGAVDEDLLAHQFGLRYDANPNRGYGGTAHRILRAIANGRHWRDVSAGAFDGMGSMGNGGGMRAGPLGAYFAGDPARVVAEARKSAVVTHAHEEGQAGAVAVALAAAWAAGVGPQDDSRRGPEMLAFVAAFAPHCSVQTAAAMLGNGSKVTAPDTVPFCLWAAARSLHSYEEALWMTLEALGDRDTTCAIVGGIVALTCSDGIPPMWLAARRPLEFRSERLRHRRGDRLVPSRRAAVTQRPSSGRRRC